MTPRFWNVNAAQAVLNVMIKTRRASSLAAPPTLSLTIFRAWEEPLVTRG